MPIPQPNPKEQETEYIGRCMKEIGSEYDDTNQAVAVCYSTYRKSKGMNASQLVMSKINQINYVENIQTKEGV